MILESRDTISYALAAYSDFMASLDRTSQTRKSSLCTTQFYKNIHTYLRVRLLHHNLSSPLHRRATRLSLHHRPKSAFSRPFEGIFLQQKNKTTFKQSWPVTVQWRLQRRRPRWGRPHRVNIALEPESNREGKVRTIAAATPIHTHILLMTPFVVRIESARSVV